LIRPAKSGGWPTDGCSVRTGFACLRGYYPLSH